MINVWDQLRWGVDGRSGSDPCGRPPRSCQRSARDTGGVSQLCDRVAGAGGEMVDAGEVGVLEGGGEEVGDEVLMAAWTINEGES